MIKNFFSSNKFWKILNTFLLIGVVGILAYAQFVPIDVIKNNTWTITVDGNPHYVNDILNVTSKYQKIRNVTGVAKRYIECQNSQGGYVRYPVNEAEANRNPGVGITGIFIAIPKSIPVPTKCKIDISIDYSIFLFRHHTEYNESNVFDLLPESSRPMPSSPSSAGSTSTTPIVSLQPKSTTPAPSSSSTSTQTTNNTNVTPQPSVNDPTPKSGLVQQIVNLLGL